MHRRSFLKNTLTASAGITLLPSVGHKAVAQFTPAPRADLEKAFLNPPTTARPWTFWQWMNGNITKEGITLDLEAMKRMGLGGALCFNNGVGMPRGPVDYRSDSWMDATLYAVKEANRLGLTLMLHNSPGYSGAGGPWITPEMSMQELVWTEIRITGNGPVDAKLSKPYAKHDYYRDAFVVAYPALPVEKGTMADKLLRVLANGKEVDKRIITGTNPETKLRIEPTTTDSDKVGPATLVFEFSEPFEARSISLTRKPEIPRDLFDGPRDHPPTFHLERSDNGTTFTSIGTFNCPELREMDTPAAFSFPAVKARYYRLLSHTPTWVSGVELQSGPRLAGWPGKTDYTHGNSGGVEVPVEQELIIDPARVVNLSDKMDSTGQLQWTPPTGEFWTILRIGHTTTGEEPAAHPASGAGLELDKFRKEAVDFHFSAFLDKVLTKLKPYTGTTKSPGAFRGITVDSWEAGKQNWTIGFPDEFKKRRDYDLVAWMPALTGRIVGSTDDTERFLWDVRRIHADLLAENFYGHMAKLCHDRGLEFHAEPYGDGNLDSLQIAQHLDVPMAEFWTRYIYGSDVTSKQAASAAHAYGRPVVAAEAFTGMPLTSKWTEYPYSMKAEADWFLTLGINRLVFHVFVHQPYTTGLPGMTMGPFGTHFDRNSTWTDQAIGWMNYLTRAQHVLQQGLFVADVCYFKGDEPTSGIPDIYGIVPKGYVGDVVGPHALLTRMQIKDSDILLPDGMRYRVMVLPALRSLSPESAKKLKELVSQGMWLVVNSRPDDAPGFSKQAIETVRQTVAELWGTLDGKTNQEHNFGKGKVSWGMPLADVLNQRNIQPDFTYTAKNQDATIHYVHKQMPDGSDIYFVTNHRRRSEQIVCSFRVSGKQPELWDAETGKTNGVSLYETGNGRTQIPLNLEPAGAVFVVFRKKATLPAYHTLSRNGVPLLTTKPYKSAQLNRYADVQNNFTIALWAKPDTFAHNNKSMLFHAPQGELVYGNGHVACAMGAGQNGVRVYERGRGPAREVLNSTQPLEGWTHLSLVYQQGKPSLYINGKLATNTATPQLATERIVHPGLETPATDEQFASYFEGNYTTPQLYPEALSTDQLNQLFNTGLSATELPAIPQLTQQADGKLHALVWQDGIYTLTGGKQTKQFEVKNSCRVEDVNGPWTVQFPKGLGAPSEIQLPQLISLRKHPDFDVKHFSGTATYRKTITIPHTDLASGKKLFLDLGRVEVIADVKLNGKPVGLLWKEPFRVDLTSAAKVGTNDLEIKVTNLWHNRLIGDEHLPIENEYSKDRFLLKLSDWYGQNRPKPGKRVTFSTWHSFEKNDPLLESGLLGPVRLLTAVHV